MPSSILQQIAGTNPVSGTTAVTPAWAGNTTAGSSIIGAVQYGTSSTVTFSDSINAFVQVGTFATDGNGFIGLFVAKNIVGGSTTAGTATFGTSQTSSALAAMFEAGGVDTVTPFVTGETAKNHSNAFGTGTDAITTTATPTLTGQGSGALLFGLVQNGTNNAHVPTAGTWFTSTSAIWGGGLAGYPEYERVASLGATAAATWTTSNGGTDFWNNVMIVLHEAAAGGGGPPLMGQICT